MHYTAICKANTKDTFVQNIKIYLNLLSAITLKHGKSFNLKYPLETAPRSSISKAIHAICA